MLPRNYELVSVYHGSQQEAWLTVFVYHIELHTENDGYAVARKGLDARDRIISMDEVTELGRRYSKDLIGADRPSKIEKGAMMNAFLEYAEKQTPASVKARQRAAAKRR